MATFTRLRRAAYGVGPLGRRVFGKGAEYTVISIGAGVETGVTIEIVGISGAFVGILRTDVQDSAVHQMKFSVDERGSGSFTLTLNRPPPFPLLRFSTVQVRVPRNDGTTDGWYKGVIRKIPEDSGTPRDKWVYSGHGMRDALTRMSFAKVFPAPIDAGQVFFEIVRDKVAPESGINLNTNKIITTTNRTLEEDFDMSGRPLMSCFDFLANFAQFRFGVDGDGDAYFLPRSSFPKRIFHVGINLESYEPFDDIDAVRNIVNVKNEPAEGSEKAGYTLAGASPYTDEISVRKYGANEFSYQVPGRVGHADADTLGEAFLDDLAEPKTSAKIKGFVIEDADDFLEPGTYRFIAPIGDFEKDIDATNETEPWDRVGSGDMQGPVLDKNVLMSGTGSQRIIWSDAIGQAAVWNGDQENVNLRRVRFWFRATAPGVLVRFGIGEHSYLENTKEVVVNVANQFIPFDWDIATERKEAGELPLRSIGEFGFEVLRNPVGSEPIVFYFDRFRLVVRDFKHSDLELARSRVTIAPGRNLIDAELGPLPPRLEDYIQGLFQQSEEARFAGEIR